jgi:hypothetical protein
VDEGCGGETKVERRDAIYELWQRAMRRFSAATHVGFPVSIVVGKQTVRARSHIQKSSRTPAAQRRWSSAPTTIGIDAHSPVGDLASAASVKS